MSMTLNLVDHLLSRGRHLQQLGREHDALGLLRRVNAFRDLTPEACEETLARLAEMLLKQGRYLKARKHLKALVVQCPDSARYQRMIAQAYDGDERADSTKAIEHYRRSLELEANQPDTLGELGLLLLRQGDSLEGLQLLRKAVELTPDTPEVVGRLAEGLRQEGELEQARQILRAARFRNPRDARFGKLWNDFQFQQLRAAQEADKADAAQPTRPTPWLLSFPQEQIAGKRIRRDGPEQPQPPHSPEEAPSRKAL